MIKLGTNNGTVGWNGLKFKKTVWVRNCSFRVIKPRFKKKSIFTK